MKERWKKQHCQAADEHSRAKANGYAPGNETVCGRRRITEQCGECEYSGCCGTEEQGGQSERL